jgi:hypothetical protein
MTKRPPAPRRYSAGSPFASRPLPVIEEFAVDDRVTHDRFGVGRVIAEEPAAVIVAFGAQHVRVPSPYRRLTKL